MINEQLYNILVQSKGHLRHVGFDSYHKLQEYFVDKTIEARLHDSEWSMWGVNNGEEGFFGPHLMVMWKYEDQGRDGYFRDNMDVDCQLQEFRDTLWCEKHDTFLLNEVCEACQMEYLERERDGMEE